MPPQKEPCPKMDAWRTSFMVTEEEEHQLEPRSPTLKNDRKYVTLNKTGDMPAILSEWGCTTWGGRSSEQVAASSRGLDCCSRCLGSCGRSLGSCRRCLGGCRRSLSCCGRGLGSCGRCLGSCCWCLGCCSGGLGRRRSKQVAAIANGGDLLGCRKGTHTV